MINWREGKAGFVGASKRLIKGFFNLSYTLTSIALDPPESSVSLLCRIKEAGQSVNSLMVSEGQSVTSSIEQTTSLLSWIDSRGQSIISTINTEGVSVRSNV